MTSLLPMLKLDTVSNMTASLLEPDPVDSARGTPLPKVADKVFTEQEKQRVNEIFRNIFESMFLSNCGNPVTFEQTM
jgi:hypothetical protein